MSSRFSTAMVCVIAVLLAMLPMAGAQTSGTGTSGQSGIPRSRGRAGHPRVRAGAGHPWVADRSVRDGDDWRPRLWVHWDGDRRLRVTGP